MLRQRVGGSQEEVRSAAGLRESGLLAAHMAPPLRSKHLDCHTPLPPPHTWTASHLYRLHTPGLPHTSTASTHLDCHTPLPPPHTASMPPHEAYHIPAASLHTTCTPHT
eukprot:364202-Chlamydomonas_euryale.AAC.8